MSEGGEKGKGNQKAAAAKKNGSSHTACPVIGIGASAGGISALQGFVSNIEAESGLAYVVVQHLDPEHESNLAAILQRHSTIEAKVVEDEAPIKPNKIYVIPPAATITIKEGKLHLLEAAEAQRKRTPIDDFLISPAEDQGNNAACVILSGTGSDGTVGLQAIKGHGGLALAQDGAEYDGMMRSAVATGLVDLIIPVEQMPAKIAECFHHITKVGTEKNAERLNRVLADNLARIAVLLRERTGHDFSSYKDSTIVPDPAAHAGVSDRRSFRILREA
jgi:two-component system CheB/CheR fusion protein